MLQIETVNKNLLSILKRLQRDRLYDDFFLVGGTALSLQIGHRKSVDIDLFTQNDYDRNAIFDNLTEKYRDRFSVIHQSNSIYQTMVENIKVDFVKVPYQLIEPAKHEDGIRYAGLKDIAAMKLHAVTNRGTEAKDFVDVFYLLRYFTLKEMLEFYKQKYVKNDIIDVKRSLVYFDDINPTTWKSLVMITDTPDIATVVKQMLVAALNDL